jgi:hypothetical protein
LHPHRLQALQRIFNGAGVVIDRTGVAIAQAIDRSRPSRRQLDLTSSLQGDISERLARHAGLPAPK